MGCDIATGYLHRLPLAQNGDASNSGVVDQKSKAEATKPTSAPVAPTKSSTTVRTPYGPGKLVEVRSDGFHIVELQWQLANGAKPRAYILPLPSASATSNQEPASRPPATVSLDLS